MSTPSFRLLRRLVLCALLLPAVPALADVSADPDSVLLVGEFVDPVCVFQHGMFGVSQRACAMVPGRVEQGMAFFDIRHRRLHTVIGMTHTEDPKAEFLRLLGDTVAVRARVWEAGGTAAIAVHAVHPAREQPPVRYRAWPWRFQASVLVGCALLAAAYLAAVGPLRRRWFGETRFPAGRASLFLLGLATVVVALNGPLHDLSDDYLFSTHMVQHLLLTEVFPPLLLLGLPAWLSSAVLRGGRASVWRALTAPTVSFALYAAVLIAWHLPPAYDLMMRSHPVHIAMHLMVMGSSLLVWWAFLGNAAEAPRRTPMTQMFFAATLALPMMAVAAPITLAKRPLYVWYELAPRVSDLSALQDQRLGGAIMWIVGGLSFWAVAIAIYLHASRQAVAVAPGRHA
jgi:putative membrane protein